MSGAVCLQVSHVLCCAQMRKCSNGKFRRVSEIDSAHVDELFVTYGFENNVAIIPASFL